MPRLFCDGVGDPRDLLPAAEAALGRRVDGWIVAAGGRWAVPPAAVSWLHANGRAVAAYWEDLDASAVQGDTAAGRAAAQRAIQAAAVAGLPHCVRLYVGIEAEWQPSADFLVGWAEGQQAGPYCGCGGVYGAPYAVPLQEALAAARAAASAGAALVLWSAQPVVGGAPAVPEWGPATCAGAPVHFWQWQEGYGTSAGAVDLDLVSDSADGLWEASPVQQFSDVPAGAWYAQDVQRAVELGLMDGVGGGRFDPLSPLSRAQAAAVAVRIYDAATHVPAPGASTVPPRQKRAHGALRSAPRPGLLDHRLWTAGTGTPPASYADPIMEALPVENQDQTGMCVACATTEVRRWWLRRLGQPDTELSAPYVYARGHQIAGATTEGMQPIWALEALRRYGAVPWAADPLNPTTEDVAQAEAASPPSLDPSAAPYRISAYGPVDASSVAAIQQAILHAPVVASIPVPLSGGIEEPVPYDGQWWVTYPPLAQAVDGHEIVLYGWETRQDGSFWWKFRNSWGSSWGSGGSAWISGSYPLEEVWSLTCVPLSPACAELAAFLAWLRADAATVLQRLGQTFAQGGADPQTAQQRAQAAYDAQVQALTQRMQQLGC